MAPHYDFAELPSPAEFAAQDDLAALRTMLLIRRFEEKAGQLYAMGHIRGSLRLCIGQEAVAVGLAMARRPGDQVVAGSRCHGYLLALGVEPEPILAELLGRSGGLAKGRAGPLPMIARPHDFFGGYASAATGASIAAGIALANRARSDGRVCLVSIPAEQAGHGAVNQAITLAAQLRLALVVLIETTIDDAGRRTPSGFTVTGPADHRNGGLDVPRDRIDGIDVRRVRTALAEAIQRARSGEGPMILDMLTSRFRGHAGPGARVAQDSSVPQDQIDPIAKVQTRLADTVPGGARQAAAIERQVRGLVAAAAASARAQPVPDPSDLPWRAGP